jgi:DNA-binding transcriptional LysR family regulator
MVGLLPLPCHMQKCRQGHSLPLQLAFMQHDDWNDYQAFLAVARAGQLARAAQLLGVDATTIGRRVRRLETRLGTHLFERNSQGQLLTEAGETLLENVETMAHAAELIGERSASDGGVAGTLRISVSEGFGTWLLARHMPALLDAHPQLTVDLVASSGFLSPSRREADIAVMLSRPKAGPVLARKLSDYALRLYAASSYLGERGMPESIDALAAGHRMVGYVPDLIYAPELAYLEEIAPSMPVQMRSSSINAQYRAIVAGAGIGVLPCFIGDSDASLCRILPDQVITRQFWIVTHRDTSNLKRVRLGKDWIEQVITSERSLILGQRAIESGG